MDKPVLTIDLGPKVILDLAETPYTGGIIAKIDDNVEKSIQEAIEDKEAIKERRREIVKKFCYKIDGKASERIVEIIYENIL